MSKCIKISENRLSLSIKSRRYYQGRYEIRSGFPRRYDKFQQRREVCESQSRRESENSYAYECLFFSSDFQSKCILYFRLVGILPNLFLLLNEGVTRRSIRDWCKLNRLRGINESVDEHKKNSQNVCQFFFTRYLVSSLFFI